MHILTPNSLLEGRCLRNPGAATAITLPQGNRTPDWPAQPATNPQPAQPAPVTLEPDGSVERKLFWEG